MAEYRCPLCLKLLTEKESFTRICMKHDRPSVIGGHWRSHQFQFAPGRFRCQQSAACNAVIGMDGVFLRHDRCEAMMPTIPSASASSSRANVTVGSRTTTLDHYEVSMVAGIQGTLPMWFPPMLLRATAEENEGRRIGTLVALSGDQQVGKTVLALQAMDREGYELEPGENIVTSEFIYCRPQNSAEPNGRWYELLDFRGRMRTNTSIGFNPSGTLPVPGDLMAVFIRPTGTRRPRQAVQPAGPRGPRTRWQRLIEGWKRFVADVRRRLALTVAEAKTQWRAHGQVAWWHTLAFYDTAGELAGAQYAALLSALDESVDKALIVVSGEEIPTGAHPSMRVAINRLNHLLSRDHIHRGLVITKTDLLIAALCDERLEAALNAAMAGQRAGIDVLRDVLQAVPSSFESRDLLSRLDEFDEVFFLSTPDFQSGVAVSRGLLPLICWCLGVDRSEIVSHP